MVDDDEKSSTVEFRKTATNGEIVMAQVGKSANSMDDTVFDGTTRLVHVQSPRRKALGSSRRTHLGSEVFSGIANQDDARLVSCSSREKS